MDEQTARSLGGKAAQKSMTKEERKRRARKAARTLGREGRAARARAGWETRKAKKADPYEVVSTAPFTVSGPAGIVSEPFDGRPLTPSNHGPDIVDRLGAFLKKHNAPDVSRKAVLAVITSVGRPTAIIGSKLGISDDDAESWRKLGNTLSSLRTAGKIVGEPVPGSAREKLWRLA